LKAMIPTRTMPAVSRVVATGRRMKGADIFIFPPPAAARFRSQCFWSSG
jgi:hypothetical protein